MLEHGAWNIGLKANRENQPDPLHVMCKGSFSYTFSRQDRPNVIQENIYYEPGDEGFEKEVKKRVEHVRKLLHRDEE